MEIGNLYWKNKKVLVTGADGFMGSHLTDELYKLGASITAYVRGNSINGTHKYSLKNIKHIQTKLDKIITGNIANGDSIKLIQENNPHVIFHLAADAFVPNSFEHPLEVMETNLIGTLNVLHAAMNLTKIEQIVCTSSSEIYGSAITESIDEEHALNPTSPYAASKVAADRYCYSYWNTYGLPIAIIRPFNTFGPRHTYDVIPKFISLALAGKPLTIHGNGKQSRDFTYISDMIRAFLIMGSNSKAIGQVVNFGTGIDVSVKEVAEKIIEYSGSSSKIEYTDDRPAQVKRLTCNFSKAKALFGWEPQVSFNEGIKLNIEWEIEKLNEKTSNTK